MTPTDKKRFLSCLVGASEYYGKALSEAVLELWWRALQSYDIASIEAAFANHIRNPDSGQFLPKAADIIRAIDGTTQDGAQRAWAKVDRTVRVVGTYRTVVFDDSLIHRVIDDMGGWMLLGTKRDDEWPFVAREFEMRYRGYSMRNERPPYPRKLSGIVDSDNGRRGFSEEAITLIGDERAARAVLNGGSDLPRLSVAKLEINGTGEQ